LTLAGLSAEGTGTAAGTAVGGGPVGTVVGGVVGGMVLKAIALAVAVPSVMEPGVPTILEEAEARSVAPLGAKVMVNSLARLEEMVIALSGTPVNALMLVFKAG